MHTPRAVQYLYRRHDHVDFCSTYPWADRYSVLDPTGRMHLIWMISSLFHESEDSLYTYSVHSIYISEELRRGCGHVHPSSAPRSLSGGYSPLIFPVTRHKYSLHSASSLVVPLIVSMPCPAVPLPWYLCISAMDYVIEIGPCHELCPFLLYIHTTWYGALCHRLGQAFCASRIETDIHMFLAGFLLGEWVGILA